MKSSGNFRILNVTDGDKYSEYINVTPGIIAKFGGRFIVRGGDKVTLEGPEEKWRIVVIEFPDLQTARDFYSSADYAEAKKIREGAALAQFVAVEGV